MMKRSMPALAHLLRHKGEVVSLPNMKSVPTPMFHDYILPIYGRVTAPS